MGQIARSTARLVPVLVVLTTLWVAGGARADGMQVPFHGSYAGTVAFTGPGIVAFNGSGNATQLGLSTNQGTATISSVVNGCAYNENVETFTAANGDTLQITSEDVACPIAPGVSHGHGDYHVSGGTGRFANATGSGTLDGQADFNTGQFSFTATGSISVPPSAS
ncbi:MAG: hypothetical protein M3Q23_10715 [Actinomycetota bacterium]|nr:hypothetical protein [Actinomycetota bacterium]